MKRFGFTASLFTLAVIVAPVAQAQNVQAPKAETPVTAASAEPQHKALSLQVMAPEAKAQVPATDKKDDVAAAPAAPTAPPPPAITLVAKVDLASQKLTVHEHGKAKFTWSISSGAQGYSTPRGTFQPGWMAKMWFSKQYDNAPMPHAVFFKDGAAIHATQAIGSLGRPASHGCVRLAPSNAAAFYALVQRHGMKHTRINVFGTPRHELIASRKPAQTTVRAAYAPHPVGGYAVRRGNGYGRYGGYNAYTSNGSPFMPQQAYRPRPVQVRVVQSGNRY